MKTGKRSSFRGKILALTLSVMFLPGLLASGSLAAVPPGQTTPASNQAGVENSQPGQEQVTPVSQPVKPVQGQADPAGTGAVKSGPLNTSQPVQNETDGTAATGGTGGEEAVKPEPGRPEPIKPEPIKPAPINPQPAEASQDKESQKPGQVAEPIQDQPKVSGKVMEKATETTNEQESADSPLPADKAEADPASRPSVPASLSSPATALLSPNGGLLTVEEKAQVSNQDGHGVITLLLPARAEQLNLTVPGQTIVRWSSLTVPMSSSGHLVRERKRLLEEQGRIKGQLAAIKLQLSLWEELPGQARLADLEEQLAKIGTAVPALVQEQGNLTARLKLVEKALAEMPAETVESGQQVQIVLKEKVAAREITVKYSYHLPDCGWQPVYYFDARPAAGEGIGVRLMADVWQRTGVDWKDTVVTLVTRPASGARAPSSLRPWIVESQPEPRAMAERSANRGERAVMAMREEAMPVAAMPAPAHAKVEVDSNAVYATWTLAVRGLPEGKSRLLMAEDTWKAPLQWLARPGERESRVWIMSKYTIPEGQVWPEGRAEYSLDGQNVGHDSFNPKGREVTLFFGADPRVTVRVESDGKKRSESGLIGKTRNLAWSWTYTVQNSHAKPVTVRIERPAPQIVDEDVKVRYENAPEPNLDSKKHVLSWDVTAPASGSAEVRHGLTISAPASMNLWPVAP